jgi:hypothetical protein
MVLICPGWTWAELFLALPCEYIAVITCVLPCPGPWDPLSRGQRQRQTQGREARIGDEGARNSVLRALQAELGVPCLNPHVLGRE